MVDQAFVDPHTKPKMKEIESTAMEIDDSSKSELDDDKRLALILLKEKLAAQNNAKKSELEKLNESIPDLKYQINAAHAKVEKIEESMSTMERLNPLERTEKYHKAIQQEETLEQRLAESQDKVKSLEEDIEEINEDIENTVATLEGKDVDQSWFSSFKKQISEMTDAARIANIKKSLDGLIDTMLTLIALFLFKTLIMPLIFLALFLKGFKYIWNIDPRDWIKQEYSNIKRSE